MFFEFTQKDTLIRVDISQASLPADLDQFVLVDKVKEMLDFWSRFDKFSVHIQKPIPAELVLRSETPPTPNP
jgi:hypothetical protein